MQTPTPCPSPAPLYTGETQEAKTCYRLPETGAPLEIGDASAFGVAAIVVGAGLIWFTKVRAR